MLLSTSSRNNKYFCFVSLCSRIDDEKKEGKKRRKEMDHKYISWKYVKITKIPKYLSCGTLAFQNFSTVFTHKNGIELVNNTSNVGDGEKRNNFSHQMI